ncbi:head maturation protease, ClpP-related [Rhodopirellula europaea]|uniref:head maturation protease, ClpP-related n=1 Tax=Rhodopirellula europaea TaxID=1263866 RepID=UPI003D26A27F
MNTSLDLHRRRFPRAIRGRGQSRSVRPFNLSRVPRCVAAANKGGRIPVQLREPTNNAPAELEIFDHIGEDMYGDGVSAASVSAFLARHRNDDVNVCINSFGGSCYEGFQMFNDLVSHRGRVVVEVKGIAFSAASVIAMAGDWVKMHKTSDWGIHRASIMAFGNQKEMASMVSWLNTLDEHAIDVYQERSGQARSKIVKWIDGESDGTVFSATQCLELGFCDEVIQPRKLTSNTSSQKRSTGHASRSVREARNRLAKLKIRLP